MPGTGRNSRLILSPVLGLVTLATIALVAPSQTSFAGFLDAGRKDLAPFYVGQLRRNILMWGCEKRSKDILARIAEHFHATNGISHPDIEEIFADEEKYDKFSSDNACGSLDGTEVKVVEILFKTNQKDLETKPVVDRTGAKRYLTNGFSIVLIRNTLSNREFYVLVDTTVHGIAREPNLIRDGSN